VAVVFSGSSDATLAHKLAGSHPEEFRYPTLTECDKTAAFDGTNRIGLF
jgi:hypothetical protein